MKSILLSLVFLLTTLFSLNAQQLSSKQIAGEEQIVQLQFQKTPDQNQLEDLRSRQFRLLQYEGAKTYTFAIPADLSSTDMRSAEWQLLSPKDQSSRLASQLTQHLKQLSPAQATQPLPITILLYDRPSPAQWNTLTESIQQASLSSSGRLLTGYASPQNIESLSQVPLVIQIERTVEDIEPLIAESRAMHQANILHAETYQLSGKGQTIGIGDAGQLSNHIDFAGRLVTETDFQTSLFHPEHVAGIMAGAGNLNPNMKGMAPASRIIVDKNFEIIRNTPDYIDQYGLTLTNNSYGPGFDCDRNGKTNSLTTELDRQLYDHPELMHVFAAGNSGNESCEIYPLGYGTILAYFPTAKNVLTVGNIDLERKPAYNTSRGPTADGRLKPEISARGVLTLSAAGEEDYKLASGTSMAAPLVSGAISLLQEHYKKKNAGEAAPGALLKAILCNSADDGGLPGPDFTYGFGVLNAVQAVRTLDEGRYFQGALATEEEQQFSIEVPQGTQQLKVLLYWADKEALPEATKALVNDLDVSLLDPLGNKVLPLVASSAPHLVEQAAQQQVDHFNNIEQIVIDFPRAGSYSVQVAAFDVPMGPQAYVLTYELYTEQLELTYPLGGEQLLPGADILLSWQAEPTNAYPFVLEYTENGGQNWTLIAEDLPADSRNFLWTLPETTSVDAFFRIRKKGTSIQSRSQEPLTIIAIPKILELEAFCDGGVEVSCETHPQAVGYELWLLQGTEMIAVQYSNSPDIEYHGNLQPETDYWMAVRVKIGTDKYSNRSIAQRVRLMEPETITPSINLLNHVNCHGAADGIAQVVVEELGNFDFFWDNGEAQAFASSLAAGEHWVTVTNDQGCEARVSVIIEEPAPLSVSALSSPASTEMAANGEVSVSLNGGTPPFQYHWSIDETLDTPVATDLEVGTYEVTITDANGCSILETVEVDFVDDDTEVKRLLGLNVFPNPTPDKLVIELDLKEAAPVRMKLHDQVGRLLLEKEYESSFSIQDEWNIAIIPEGVYWLQFEINKEKTVRKVVKIK